MVDFYNGRYEVIAVGICGGCLCCLLTAGWKAYTHLTQHDQARMSEPVLFKLELPEHDAEGFIQKSDIQRVFFEQFSYEAFFQKVLAVMLPCGVPCMHQLGWSMHQLVQWISPQLEVRGGSGSKASKGFSRLTHGQ
jgi:hypothetical protein